jgi:hypothetical protein
VLRTGGRKGPISKTVTVFSNAVDTPELALELSGEIAVDVELVPPRLNFPELARNESGVLPFIVKMSDPSKFKLGGLRVEDPRFSLVKKTELNYELHFKGSSELERLSATLIVEVQGERNRNLEVPISVRVVGDINYTRNLYFLKRESGIEAKAVEISSRSGRVIKVVKAYDPDGLVKVKAPKKAAKELSLEVTVANPTQNYKQPKRGMLIIRTDDKEMPELSVNFIISEPRAPVVNRGKSGAPSRVRLVQPAAPEEAPTAPR